MGTFIQPTFIRKNTPELREKLEVLGYYPHPAEKKLYEEYPNYVGPSLYTGRGFYSMAPIGYEEEVENEIYCGDNEDLFLAIASLREDTDKGQWFCANEYNWSRRFFICKYDTIKEHINMVTDGDCGSYKDFHKATVKELIEHFKEE